MDINSFYDFSVYGNSILGSSYRNARLMATLDYHTAKKFSTVDYTHRQIKPYLPESTPKDISKFTFYLFRYKERDVVVAREWIDIITIELVQQRNVTIDLMGISDTKKDIVLRQLGLLGITYKVRD